MKCEKWVIANKMSYKIETKTIQKLSDGKKTIESTLDAHFNFWNETAPKDRKDVKDRIKTIFEKSIEKERVYDFPAIPDEYVLKPIPKMTNHFDYVGFVGKRFGLGLYVYLSSSNDIHLEETIDFTAINNYVLTGKNPDKKH